MRKIVFLIILFLPFFAGAQPSEVTLVVTGEGSTKEEATNNALRSAVEQAFGVFVSSNTEILNEEIVKDEIATISSGNIKSYVENAYIERSDGVKSITLTALVSISQLVNYTKNHGYSTEFAGSTFGANMRLYELNRDATRKVLDNFYKELLDQVALMYDYKLSVSDPVIKDDTGIVQMTVDVLANSNTKKIGDYFFNKLKAIGSTYEEVEPLIKMGNAFYIYALFSFNKQNKKGQLRDDIYRNTLLFSYGLDIVLLNLIFSSAMIGFEVKDNCGNSYTFNKPETWNYVTSSRNYVDLRPMGRTGGYQVSNRDRDIPVITRNTDYESGEVLYRLQHEESIDKSILFSISSFDIVPNLQAGICSVLSGLYGEENVHAPTSFVGLDHDECREYAEYFSKITTHGFYIGQWISDENGVVFGVNGDRNKAIIVRSIGYHTWNDMQTISGELEGWRLPNRYEIAKIVKSDAVKNSLHFFCNDQSHDSWVSEDDPEDPDRALYCNPYGGFYWGGKEHSMHCVIVKEIQSKKESMQDVPNNDDEAIAFLKKVYPNSIDGSFTGDKLCTDRFEEYSRIECEYDPIYQTQDCYSAAVLPNPTFSKYSKFENAYTVQWQRYEHKEKVTVIVVLKKEEGRWLIDNIVQGDRLLFDYSKPPVSIYVDF